MEYTSTNIKSMVIDTIIKFPQLDSTTIRKKIKIEFGYIMTIQEFENTINVKGKLIDCLDYNDGKYVFKDSHKSEINILKNGQPSFFEKEIYIIYSEKKSELDKLINQNLFEYNFKNIISKIKLTSLIFFKSFNFTSKLLISTLNEVKCFVEYAKFLMASSSKRDIWLWCLEISNLKSFNSGILILPFSTSSLEFETIFIISFSIQD